MIASWLPDRFQRPVPWRVGDLLALVGTWCAGIVLVLVAWFCSDSATSVDSQVRWLNVGVIGVITLGVGNLLWLITGRRAIGELRRLVLPGIPLGPLASTEEVAPDGGADRLIASGP